MSNLRRCRKSVILALAAAGLLLTGCEYAESGAAREAPGDAGPIVRSSANRIKAVTFDARRPPDDSALHAVRELGVTHLALVSFAFQDSPRDPHLRFSPDVRWYSESAEGARALARAAGELGMGVILKPHVWLRGGAWTADIDFDTEQQWSVWEAGYRAYLIHVSRLAEEIGADLLVVGTELSNPVQERPEFWRRLIDEIRTVYDGRLTYGANWYDDYLEVPFWEELDAIGVQAYFPLSSADHPDLEAIKGGWREHVEALEELSARTDRPVLFTELGYRSVPYAAHEPWRWPSRDEQVEPDYHLQADLYRGFFESIWNRPWFSGAIIWKFYPNGSTRGRGRELDFTPQEKPAEEVLRSWFRKMPAGP